MKLYRTRELWLRGGWWALTCPEVERWHMTEEAAVKHIASSYSALGEIPGRPIREIEPERDGQRRIWAVDDDGKCRGVIDCLDVWMPVDDPSELCEQLNDFVHQEAVGGYMLEYQDQ